MAELTHFDASGASRMVDVSTKPITWRLARAEALVVMRPETLTLILDRKLAKGDVFEVARLAGIMATKKTPELIPLCHSLGLESVEVADRDCGCESVRIEAAVSVHGRTGVEMEAMTAVVGRRTDHVRHVQVGRSGNVDRTDPAAGKVRRKERAFPA